MQWRESWNALPVGLRSSSFGLDTIAYLLEYTSILILTTGHALLKLHFVGCDTVTVSPNQLITSIIMIIIS